nr:immunoglobulin heavy chain junction region [Mus musculus]
CARVYSNRYYAMDYW